MMIHKSRIETVLIVGLGSIGMRHLELLRIIKPDIRIVVLRHKDSKVDDSTHIDYITTNIHDALNCKPDFAIISNPSSFHVDTAIPLAQASVHLLIEKPISSSLRNVEKLISLTKKIEFHTAEVILALHMIIIIILQLPTSKIMKRILRILHTVMI